MIDPKLEKFSHIKTQSGKIGEEAWLAWLDNHTGTPPARSDRGYDINHERMCTANNEPEINLDTWIISDTHFFHENIGKYCNRPENWQDLILKNWNDLIAPDETVLHLGDFALGKKSNFVLLTEFLNGRLFLIRGNHDRLGTTYCSSHGVTLIQDPYYVSLEKQSRLVFSHRPIVPLTQGITNLHGHIHNTAPPPEGSSLGPHHINMSVEVRDYRPWKLRDILQRIG